MLWAKIHYLLQNLGLATEHFKIRVRLHPSTHIYSDCGGHAVYRWTLNI